LKDHYKTLEISTQASPQEIKEAYRRMARRYHPDKNEDLHKATAYFQDIQEAYEVLSNPARRRTYDKELRHAGQYQWQKKDQLYSTEQVLKQAASLVKYINTLDGRSIHYDALADYILALLSEENILLLQRAADADTNALITKHILYVCESMVSSRLFSEIAERLNRINAANPVLLQELEAGLAQRRAQERRNNMIPYAAIGIVLLIAVLMCLILFT
jgi:molecular chaperone DnaJ